MEYVHMYFTELIDAQLTISNNQTNFLFYFIDNSQEQQKFCSYFNHTLDYLKNQTLLGNEVSEESLEKYWKAIVLADKLQAALPMKFTSSQKTKV